MQVWFQNARAKFRRNLLRQENGGVDKADGTSLPALPSADSGALSPPGTATTLTDLPNPSLTVVTAVISSMDSHESASLADYLNEPFLTLGLGFFFLILTLLFIIILMIILLFTKRYFFPSPTRYLASNNDSLVCSGLQPLGKWVYSIVSFTKCIIIFCLQSVFGFKKD